MRRHLTVRTASAHPQPRARVGAASGSCLPYGRGRHTTPPRGPGPAPGDGVPYPPASGVVPPPEDAPAPQSDMRRDFLRALRSPRPLHPLDDPAASDPVTTAICWFTGTA